MILEKNLNKLFASLPVFYKKLHPHRLHTGKYIEGEPFDYLLIMEGETYCFDAKEQNDDLYFKEIPIHQFNDLLKAEKHGAIVFFIIYFTNVKKLCFIHPSVIMRDNKATPASEQVDNNLKVKILKCLTNK